MTLPFPTVEVVEGRARLLVPDVPRRKGPLPRGDVPFYNPTNAVNRDVSAVLLARWPGGLRDAFDGLAATGAWGIRIALEASVPRVVFNDRSRDACDLVRANLDRNHVDGEVRTADMQDVLRSESFDFVDIDPFGPPTPFLRAAIAGDRPEFGLGVTATDTAPLSGTYPEACVRRYGARPLRCPQGHEIGLRILIGHIARRAAEAGRVIEPVLSFSAEHFLRTHLRVLRGRDPAPIATFTRDPDGGFHPCEPSERGSIGPLWSGPLSDREVLSRLRTTEWSRSQAMRLLDALRSEADLPPFFASTDDLARRLRVSPPRLDRFLDALRAMGYRAARTHFNPRGVKTDAPMGDIERAFSEATN